jgi:hypothetical protein
MTSMARNGWTAAARREIGVMRGSLCAGPSRFSGVDPHSLSLNQSIPVDRARLVGSHDVWI